MRYPILAIAGLLSITVLGYGYWHQATHASFYITVEDFSNRERPRPIADVTMVLRDESSKELARYTAEGLHHVMSLSQPERYACRDAEKKAPADAGAQWQECHERYSRWLAGWIKTVNYADITAGTCTVPQVPVKMSPSDQFGWLLWWVPLVHVGGKPYAYFTLHIGIDLQRCSVVYQYGGSG